MRYIIQVTFLSNSIQLLALPQYLVKKFRILLATTEYEKFYASLIVIIFIKFICSVIFSLIINNLIIRKNTSIMDLTILSRSPFWFLLYAFPLLSP